MIQVQSALGFGLGLGFFSRFCLFFTICTILACCLHPLFMLIFINKFQEIYHVILLFFLVIFSGILLGKVGKNFSVVLSRVFTILSHFSRISTRYFMYIMFVFVMFDLHTIPCEFCYCLLCICHCFDVLSFILASCALSITCFRLIFIVTLPSHAILSSIALCHILFYHFLLTFPFMLITS